jgi:hypothetical protein
MTNIIIDKVATGLEDIKAVLWINGHADAKGPFVTFDYLTTEPGARGIYCSNLTLAKARDIRDALSDQIDKAQDKADGYAGG